MSSRGPGGGLVWRRRAPPSRTVQWAGVSPRAGDWAGARSAPPRAHALPAAAPSLLGEPAGALGGTLACRQGMRNSKAGEFGEENLRRLEALHRGGLIGASG